MVFFSPAIAHQITDLHSHHRLCKDRRTKQDLRSPPPFPPQIQVFFDRFWTQKQGGQKPRKKKRYTYRTWASFATPLPNQARMQSDYPLNHDSDDGAPDRSTVSYSLPPNRTQQQLLPRRRGRNTWVPSGNFFFRNNDTTNGSTMRFTTSSASAAAASTTARNKQPTVIFRSGYSPRLTEWTWIEWVTAIGVVITFSIIVAGFVLLVLQNRRCCL